MDGSIADHSDSDSGESWTLLEHSPSYADEAPELAENLASHNRETLDTDVEKDEDTDGISIISDSEPESSSPCEISLEKYIEENRPTEQHTPHYISVTPLPTNNTEQHDSIRDEDDFLTDHNGKNKTYVHRRNKRLSTVLNIIMLGSVITAAGVAIGHMWGARNDCSMHTAPSVNKILSNLYKLQEENAYLRSKLKELTLITNTQMQRKTTRTDTLIQKPQRCRKVYEESLNSKVTDKITKCVDNNIGNNILETHLTQQQYEKDFLNDLDRLKNAYKLNKSWLDHEVTKRMSNEEQARKKSKNVLQNTQLNTVQEEQMMSKNEDSNTKKFPAPVTDNKSLEEDYSQFVVVNTNSDEDLNKLQTEKRISYADSLKTEQPQTQPNKMHDTEGSKWYTKVIKDQTIRKNRKGEGFDALEISLSDFKFTKDDRYIGPKNKRDRKKNDRQKLHKKQKRKNKYEQWEMKGGYMKDYDDISTASSHENELASRINLNNLVADSEHILNNQPAQVDKFTILEGNVHKIKRDKYFKSPDKSQEKATIKNKEFNWFDKRASLRAEARKKLEQEMFGETSLNNASWYFRRMQKREQCRAKSDNSTNRKFTKRHMNYKIKH